MKVWYPSLLVKLDSRQLRCIQVTVPTIYCTLFMFSKLKQFKDLRDKAKTLQTTLAAESAEGSAGWGKVKITLDGNQRATRVEIDPGLMNEHDKLQSLVKEAINDGMEKLQKLLANKMKDIGGLDLAKDIQALMGKK